MSEIKNKTITIQGFDIVQNNTKYVITDQDNQKYSFFMQWEGQDTSQFAQWKNMELGQGKTVRIGYTEVKKFNQKANREATYKNIMNFLEPAQQSAPVPKGVQDEYGKRLAIHGFVNGLLASGKNPDDIDIQSLLRLENRVNEMLNGKQEVEGFPVDDEGIPF